MSTCLKRAAARALAVTTLALSAAGAANAAYIHAALTKVGGDTWDASFTVGADPGQTVGAFSVYFDWTQVSNIQVLGSPVDWDSIAIQADGGLASDGFFDALALAGGIADGDSLGGFVARFDWADPAGPSTLRFTINDPVTFEALERGAVELTSGGGGNSVPEPAPVALAALGLLAATVARRRPEQARP